MVTSKGCRKYELGGFMYLQLCSLMEQNISAVTALNKKIIVEDNHLLKK